MKLNGERTDFGWALVGIRGTYRISAKQMAEKLNISLDTLESIEKSNMLPNKIVSQICKNFQLTEKDKLHLKMVANKNAH